MTRKNTHMTHIDEALFEGGTEVTNQINRILMQGTYELTVKWDGAPSIFVGRDPADGEFFIATKSLFNKSPKLYKSSAEIFANEPGSKAYKLSEAFEYLCVLDIPLGTVLQGDLIFTNDDIELKDNRVTVHPNTLMYSWDVSDDDGVEVLCADVGVVFHTTYTGCDNLQEYVANFGFDIDAYDIPENLWIKSANMEFTFDISTVPVMSYQADIIVEIMAMLPSSRVGAGIKSFYNARVRDQQRGKPNLSDYLSFVQRYYDNKVFNKIKSDAGFKRAQDELETFMTAIMDNADCFYEAFEYVAHMQSVKANLLNQLHGTQTVSVEIDGVRQSTGHEGYVIVDTITGDAFKLVDRNNFSFFNFSDNVKKGWQKDVH